MELGESTATLHAQPEMAVGDVDGAAQPALVHDVDAAAQPALVHDAAPSLDGGRSGGSRRIKKREESADAKEMAPEDLKVERKR